MTIPAERTRAVQQAERLLLDLANPAQTKRVPKAVREAARRVLRHYPGAFDLEEAARACPDVWGPPQRPPGAG